mmetsp:Transcript_43552/g.57655  ORF Transcript_43552/g.57655 Transcript_43552/m.57655 type:complete len:101 (+) Transcript_43552:1214-1516(+)
MMTKLFRYKESQYSSGETGEQQRASRNLANLKEDFQASERIKPHRYCCVKWLCFLSSRNKRYQMLLKKATSKVRKEMDLQKFIHRQRVSMAATAGLLNAP